MTWTSCIDPSRDALNNPDFKRVLTNAARFAVHETHLKSCEHSPTASAAVALPITVSRMKSLSISTPRIRLNGHRIWSSCHVKLPPAQSSLQYDFTLNRPHYENYK